MDPPKQQLRRNRIPVRKRLKHVKRHVQPKQPEEGPSNEPPNTASDDSVPISSPVNIPADEADDIEAELLPSWLKEHDYSSNSPTSRPSSSLSRPGSSLDRPSSSLSHVSNISGTLSVSLSDLSVDVSESDASFLHVLTPEHQSESAQDTSVSTKTLLLDVRNKLFLMLPETFVPIVDGTFIHILMTRRRQSKAVQRQVTVSINGDVKLQVHGEEVSVQSVMSGVRSAEALTKDTCGHFVDRITDVVKNLRLLEICAGADHKEFKEALPVTSQGNIETDVFKECRYTETFRSKKCSLLVESKNWRCQECTKLQPILKSKLQTLQQEMPQKHTNHRFMSSKHKDKVLARKQRTIKSQQQTITRLQSRMKEIIEKEGVKVDSNMSDDLFDILQSTDLNPNQALFLQQQVKACKVKKASAMRWHPILIRMALSLYLKAPGAYKELQESGFVKLPTSRTLFDYSHVTKIEPGIDSTVLESVAKRVETIEGDRSQSQYHVIMVDEMHISKNLVLLKSTGELIGFKDLDVLDEELLSLEAHFSEPDKPLEPQLASKVMAFMVKGVTSTLKHVVASYPVCNPSARQMYSWTWEIIGALERSGVKVIALTCDGAPTNRAFIKLHKPHTITSSGVIFDTVNTCAPERLIYFFSDVPHLLKTIKNAFFNSRKNSKNKKKTPRLLKKNGQLIVWDTVIRLYLAKKDKTFRKSYKLNAQNVFPDSYSRMKVPPAAQVMSHTVGTDIKSQGWPGTSETVDFILRVNNWFDLLNGAFSSQGVKKNNHRLHPYTMKDVEDFENNVEGSRFQEILDFVTYLKEWKEQVEANKNASQSQSFMSDMGVQPLGEEESFHALDDTHEEVQEEEAPSARNLLPHQTMLGVEMSCRAFIGATTFLLRHGDVTFINARVFCQDPLEQNFGRQRMAGGGSNNPNYHQYLHKQRGFSTIGELSAANKRGNTEVLKETDETSSEALPKRRRSKRASTV